MSSIATGYEHIVVREDGIAIVDGTRIKVAHLIAEVMAYGSSPENYAFNIPISQWVRSIPPWLIIGIILRRWNSRSRAIYAMRTRCANALESRP